MPNRAAEAEGILRRDEIIEYIKQYVEDHGYSPSREEMADAVGVSRRAIYNHLRILEEEERIRVGRGGRAVGVIEE